jgi:hypothetical protein
LGIFGIKNKPSIRKCLKRIPKHIEFSPDYFSEFALALHQMQVVQRSAPASAARVVRLRLLRAEFLLRADLLPNHNLPAN